MCTKRDDSDLSKLDNIKKNIRFVPATIETVLDVMKYTQFDYVLNMAGKYCRDGELDESVIEANLEFPLKVINATIQNGTKHYLTIGTSLPYMLNMYADSCNVKFRWIFAEYIEKGKSLNTSSFVVSMLKLDEALEKYYE